MFPSAARNLLCVLTNKKSHTTVFDTPVVFETLKLYSVHSGCQTTAYEEFKNIIFTITG